MAAWERRVSADTLDDDEQQLVALVPDGLADDDRDAVLALLRLAVERSRFHTVLRGVDDRGQPVVVAITRYPDALAVSVLEEPAHELDPLTGVLARDAVAERLRRALAESARRSTLTGVLWLDLDRFRTVNATNGAAAGDQLLAEVTSVVRRTLRPGDALGRPGSDELVVVAPGLHSVADAVTLAERLRQTVEAFVPRSVPGAQVTGSVGVIVGGSGDLPEALLGCAEVAALVAKSNGRNRCEVYDDDVRGVIEHSHAVQRRLRAALDEDAFVLRYEPVLDPARRSCPLLRITLALPADHVTAHEEILMSASTLAVSRRILTTAIDHAACTLLDVTHAQTSFPRLAVPVPIELLSDDALVLAVVAVLHDTGLAPRRLTLEIPEEVLVTERARVDHTLTKLRAAGVHLLVGGFTASTLAVKRLHSSPFELVEIHPTLLADLATRRPRGSRPPIQQLLGDERRVVVAAGTDTRSQLETARAVGCHLVRGRALYPDGPGTDLVAVLDASRSAATMDRPVATAGDR